MSITRSLSCRLAVLGRSHSGSVSQTSLATAAIALGPSFRAITSLSSCLDTRRHSGSCTPFVIERCTKLTAHTHARRRDFCSSVALRNDQKTPNDGPIHQPRGKIYDSLPSTEEKHRSHIRKRLNNVMDKAQSNLVLASQRINDLTGYSGIEGLKVEIERLEILTRETRSTVIEAKDVYSEAIQRRSGSQREINDLLQRQSSWTSGDLERFTSLYRDDHSNQIAEQDAEKTLLEAERVAEETAERLSKTILARYHEEQIWSDKIRRVSTWGTWGLMGLNLLLFLVFQIGVEPWRRARLVKGFEEKVREALQLERAVSDTAGLDTTTSNKSPEEQSAKYETPASATDTFPYNDEPQDDSFLGQLEAAVDELFSDEVVQVTRYQLSTVALEGAFVGSLLTTLVTLVILLGVME